MRVAVASTSPSIIPQDRYQVVTHWTFSVLAFLALITFEAIDSSATAQIVNRVAVHRYYSSSGEHFYTTSMNKAIPPKFAVEAYDYFYLSSTPGPNLVPFYRCYHAGGMHFYTTSSTCEESGAINEDLLGYIATSPGSDLTPLRRLFNRDSGDHLYTVRAAEQRKEQQHYIDEGIVGYVWVPPLYVTPIVEMNIADTLDDMKKRLAPDGSGPNVVLGWSRSTWYMTEIKDDYQYDPSSLQHVFELAKEKGLPLVINLNGGRWSNQSPLIDFVRGSIPLFRLYLPNGDHLLTASGQERRDVEGPGVTYEGIVGGILASQFTGSVPLYRLYRENPINRVYTTDSIERHALIDSKEYKDEGIVGFVLKQGGNYFEHPVKPLYRVYNNAGHHVFTSNQNEKNTLVSQGWRDERVSCYLLDSPWVSLDQDDYSMFSYELGQQFISISRLNRIYYSHKKRNLQAAAEQIQNFRRDNPDLFIGVSLDSETMLSDQDNRFADYNAMAIQEWRQWLSGTGIYHPITGEYRGQARSPVFSSISDFNTAMRTKFTNWDDIQPPRIRDDSDPLWREWRTFGIYMVAHHTQDMANWIENQGIPREVIYNHQTPGLKPFNFGDSLLTAQLFDRTTMGITTYGDKARNATLIASARSYARHFGIFEWNATADMQEQYNALLLVYNNTGRIVAPNKWPTEFNGLSIKNMPIEIAIRNFIRDYRQADK